FRPSLFIPNAFTPNGDGVNEIFTAAGSGVEVFEGMIFDRWGEKIYTWNDINGGWDGTRNGRFVQQDVYIVAIRVKNICDKDFNEYHRGTVTVIR
ncbi:MAG: gliding motility-associated C-terminal domain-containing protein, partial [Bacteroidetes bacterium]|nr:gliding motility-associated C-terminal domain-containing protein [Bacteroidota bacterium]